MRFVLAVVVTALTLTACVGDPKPVVTTVQPDVILTPTPSPSANPTAAAMVELNSVLLTSAEVGSGVAVDKWRYADQRPPCGTSTVDRTVGPTFAVGRAHLDKTKTVLVVQEIRLYQDVAEATWALASRRLGLVCKSGFLYDAAAKKTPISIGKPADATTASGADEASSWTLSNAQRRIVFVAARYRASVITFELQTAAKPPAGLPSLPALVAKTVTKIKTR